MHPHIHTLLHTSWAKTWALWEPIIIIMLPPLLLPCRLLLPLAPVCPGLLLSCIQDPDPCVFFEPKML